MTTDNRGITRWTDDEFLAAIEGYVKCLSTDQEARLSRQELERLASIARTSINKRATH